MPLCGQPLRGNGPGQPPAPAHRTRLQGGQGPSGHGSLRESFLASMVPTYTLRLSGHALPPRSPLPLREKGGSVPILTLPQARWLVRRKPSTAGNCRNPTLLRSSVTISVATPLLTNPIARLVGLAKGRRPTRRRFSCNSFFCCPTSSAVRFTLRPAYQAVLRLG